MSRRKLSFPILSASNDVLNKDYIKNNIEDLTKGEVVLNISGDNSTMLFFDENENLAIFESSVLVDKKIEKIIEGVNFGENKEVLDGITSGMVESWNNAEQNAVSSSKTYTDAQINFILSGASETFDTLKEIEVWINAHSGQAVTIIENLNNLNNSAHTHSNKGILDGITEEKVTAWDAVGGKQDVISDIDDIRNGAAKGATALQEVPSEYVTETELQGKGFLTEHQDISGKQDLISDLDDIRNGAAKGATALQSVPAEYVTETELQNKGYATQTWVEGKKYLTSHQDISGKQDVISDIDDIRNGAAKGATALQEVPSEYVTETELQGKGFLTEHQDISGKQDLISDLDDIRNGAAKGATALQSVPAEYVTETELQNKGYATQTWVEGKKYLTSHQDISGKQDVISDLDTIRSGAAKGATALQTIGLTKVSLKTYLLGSAIKEGAVSALATSTDDIYMEDGELYATSDERLKDFGDNISVDLDKLSEIPKAYYTWKTKPQGRKMIGLSAQKIGALYPEVVSTDENGKMAVSYEKLSVIALAAIDELHKENEELKNRLKRIEEKLGL